MSQPPPNQGSETTKGTLTHAPVERKTQVNDARHLRPDFLTGLAFTFSFAAFVGLLDFVLFEIHRNRPAVFELIFSKPSFFGQSYLSFHILTFVLTAIFCFLCWAIIIATFRRWDKFNNSHSLRFVTAIGFSLLITVLRLKRLNQQPLFLTIFLTILLIAIFFEYRRTRSFFSHLKTDKIRNYISPFANLSVGLVIFTISFLLPDFYGIYSNFFTDPSKGATGRPNIILLVLDTVRADHLSCYGYTKNQTPNLDQLSREGSLFLNAYSAAPWTVPSHASMFTGLLPSDHGTDWRQTTLSEDHLTIAEYLRDLGYRTAGFSENPNISIARGFAQGFEEFHDMWRVPLFVRVMQKLNRKIHIRDDRREYAKRTVGLTQRWIDGGPQEDQPFFAFVNLMAAHLPRYPRSDRGGQSWSSEYLRDIEPVNLVPERFYLERFHLGPEELEVMRTIYDQEISFIDTKIGRFVKFLREHDLSENTLLIVTSDHGELFGEHGLIEHQLCLYEPVLRVPLIIRYPKIFDQDVIDLNVSNLNIFPTIIEVIQAIEHRPVMFGSEVSKSLADKSNVTAPIIAEFSNGVPMLKTVFESEQVDFDYSPFDQDLKCIIMDQNKYIWHSTGKDAFYDIEADPDELVDLSEAGHDLMDQLKIALGEMTMAGEKIQISRPEAPVDPATKEALRALGYEF